MTDEREFFTPMMQQYAKIKSDYQDAILFFRLGDFYEMFLEDAKVGAQILGITLTSRHKGSDGEVPMAGVPFHAAEGYIRKLVKNGYKVAICEQVSEPESGRDVVEREVVRVVTPSTVLGELEEEVGLGHHLMTFALHKGKLGVAFISPSSGEVLVTEQKLASQAAGFREILQELDEYITRFSPAEILLTPEWYEKSKLVGFLHRRETSPFRYRPSHSKPSEAHSIVRGHYDVSSLEAFGLRDKTGAVLALSYALTYLRETQKSSLDFLKNPQLILPESHLNLAGQSIRNLELFSSLRSGEREVSLFNLLDETVSALGRRKLKHWLLRPLLKISAINDRLDALEWFRQNRDLRRIAAEELSEVTDIERNLSRLSVGVGNARDMVGLRESLIRVDRLHQRLLEWGAVPVILKRAGQQVDWEKVRRLVKILREAIQKEPAAQLTEGGIIKEGYSNKLDELRDRYLKGQEWLNDLQQREREATGIDSLKIDSNKVYGYYIEVSKAKSDLVPEHYVRKQTLTNSERYIISELKEYEEKVFEAREQAHQLEYRLYHELVDEVLEYIEPVQELADYTAVLDVLQGLAALAIENGYCRPRFVTESVLEVDKGRHPVVEQMLGRQFVPNDLYLDSSNKRLMVLTGANMAGKSTYVRQVALLVIMAQIGSYVPAEKMKLGIIDQVHTRIGAMDNLARGMSTFMVEMLETANILNNLTDRSLVILDEVGRGTSNFDGLSIAWAVSEYLIKNSTAKVMFATHYAELTELEQEYDGVINYHMAVAKKEEEVIFLYQAKQGEAQYSYGIQVAKQAGLPLEVTKRAAKILTEIQKQAKRVIPGDIEQLKLF